MLINNVSASRLGLSDIVTYVRRRVLTKWFPQSDRHARERAQDAYKKKNWSCSKLQRISRAARWCMSVNIFSCWLTKQHFSLCFSIRFSFSIERLHSSSCCRDGRFIVRGDFFILERFFWIFFVAINLFVFRGFFFSCCRPTFVCGRGKKGKRR